MGSNTKSYRGALALILLAATLLGGCVFADKAPGPSSGMAPVVTIMATPTPRGQATATPAPTPVAIKLSNDVKVLPAGERGLIFFESYPGKNDRGKQYENVTIYLANDGASAAKDVVVTLSETDGHDANSLVQQDFKVGDMENGERRIFTMITEEHDQARSILIKVNLKWGEYGEYSNPATYVDVTKSVLWMMTFPTPL